MTVQKKTLRSRGKRPGITKETTLMDTVKFFHKNVVEGKSISRCAREMDLSRTRLYQIKGSEDFRQMALEYLDSSELDGVKGVCGKLVEALEATVPVSLNNADGSQRVKFVPDHAARSKALQEIIKIYGLHAPIKKDVTARISLSSDSDIFSQIEQAERSCRFVESYEAGERGFELAKEECEFSAGSDESRKRALLQDTPLPEPE